MRKIGVGAAICVWIVTAVVFLKNINGSENNILSAFKTTDYSYMSAKIVAYGKYDVIMDDNYRQGFLKDIASGLGISSPYSINSRIEENKKITECEKYSDNGEVMLELVEADGVNHLGIVLDLKDNVESAESYEQLVREIFDAEGIDGNVNLYLEGHIKGTLNYEERSNVADDMLDVLGATIVTESRENDVFSIYAYTDRIPRYIKSIGKKININITASYDEDKDVTVIYLATPLNNLDY